MKFNLFTSLVLALALCLSIQQNTIDMTAKDIPASLGGTGTSVVISCTADAVDATPTTLKTAFEASVKTSVDAGIDTLTIDFTGCHFDTSGAAFTFTAATADRAASLTTVTYIISDDMNQDDIVKFLGTGELAKLGATTLTSFTFNISANKRITDFSPVQTELNGVRDDAAVTITYTIGGIDILTYDELKALNTNAGNRDIIASINQGECDSLDSTGTGADLWDTELKTCYFHSTLASYLTLTTYPTSNFKVCEIAEIDIQQRAGYVLPRNQQYIFEVTTTTTPDIAADLKTTFNSEHGNRIVIPADKLTVDTDMTVNFKVSIPTAAGPLELATESYDVTGPGECCNADDFRERIPNTDKCQCIAGRFLESGSGNCVLYCDYDGDSFQSTRLRECLSCQTEFGDDFVATYDQQSCECDAEQNLEADPNNLRSCWCKENFFRSGTVANTCVRSCGVEGLDKIQDPTTRTCVSCPAGKVPNSDHTACVCQLLNTYENADGDCVQCPWDSAPNGAGNGCDCVDQNLVYLELAGECRSQCAANQKFSSSWPYDCVDCGVKEVRSSRALTSCVCQDGYYADGNTDLCLAITPMECSFNEMEQRDANGNIDACVPCEEGQEVDLANRTQCRSIDRSSNSMTLVFNALVLVLVALLF